MYHKSHSDTRYFKTLTDMENEHSGPENIKDSLHCKIDAEVNDIMHWVLEKKWRQRTKEPTQLLMHTLCRKYSRIHMSMLRTPTKPVQRRFGTKAHKPMDATYM